jgi:hypothetical protein
MSDLTRQQLCAQLQVSESTVRRLELEGLPFSLESKSKRYDLAAVKAWAKARRPQATRERRPAEVMRDALLRDPATLAFFGFERSSVEKWTEQPAPQPPTKEEMRKRRAEARAEKLRREWEMVEQRAALARFHANKRRAAKIQRTPPWADLDAMRAIYAEATRLSIETGIPHHVDHEIPLQGEFVSGLHVHNNLQILTASENSRKRNRYEV